MSIVTGGRHYAHVNALRHDGINPPLLGMSKVCSDDSVRRALKSIDQEKAKVWLKQHLTVPLHPIMQDGGWILDVDSTVKPKFSSWSKEVLCQVVDVDPITVFGNFNNG